MKRSRLHAQLRRHEGWKLKPYRDTTGKLTIGCGRNLDDVGLSDDEVQLLLDHDITRVWQECVANIEGFGALDDVRQHVLLDMCFNLGLSRLLHFVKLLAAVARRDFDDAAREMLDSRWATQVGDRAQTLAQMMRTGVESPA
jgi:lysozyme